MHTSITNHNNHNTPKTISPNDSYKDEMYIDKRYKDESYKERELIKTLKELVSIPSVFGEEHRIAEYIRERLEDFAEVRIEKVDGFGGNVVAECINDESYPTLILNGHIDTVPVMEGWKTDPYKPIVHDGKLIGLGACDMKAGVAINMALFKEFASRKAWNANIIFVGACDEEGNSKGSYEYLQKFKKRKFDKERTLALLTEPTNEKLMLGCRGRYVVEIKVKGVSAHGARPYLGVNAIEDAAKVIEAISKVPIKRHPRLGKGSICVLKIEGGGDSLSVPDLCKIRVDRHVVPGETKSSVMKDIVNAVLNKVSKSNLRSKIEFNWMERPTPFLEPYELSKTRNVVNKFLIAAKEFGLDVRFTYGESVGDYNLFGRCMPTLVFGPSGGKWHSHDEFVNLESVLRCKRVLSRFIEILPELKRF